MLKTLSEILSQAEKGQYAVIAPDFPSLYVMRILLEAAETSQTPLILSYSSLFKPLLDVRSYARFVQIVRDEIEASSIPAVLHLDHATDLNDIAQAIDFGFTSVMIDASFESYEVNLEKTQKVVSMAKKAGVSVEAEIGHVSSGTEYISHETAVGFLTNSDSAVSFVANSGIDALAVAIGTVHGKYVGQPSLDFGLLKELDQRISIPLVLHGTSGLSKENIEQSVKYGIRKINLYTDLIMGILECTYNELAIQQIDPIKVGEAQSRAIKRIIDMYIIYSGSKNKAHVLSCIEH
jgi:ketose-bisphosphate aldolase